MLLLCYNVIISDVNGGFWWIGFEWQRAWTENQQPTVWERHCSDSHIAPRTTRATRQIQLCVQRNQYKNKPEKKTKICALSEWEWNVEVWRKLVDVLEALAILDKFGSVYREISVKINLKKTNVHCQNGNGMCNFEVTSGRIRSITLSWCCTKTGSKIRPADWDMTVGQGQWLTRRLREIQRSCTISIQTKCRQLGASVWSVERYSMKDLTNTLEAFRT